MGANQGTLVSASEVMHRIRTRLGVTAVSASSVVSATLANIEIAASEFVAPSPTVDFPIKAEYVIGDFLAYEDVAFVVNAYRAILQRDPDEHALPHLTTLRAGEMTKVELLGTIRWSKEGRARGVHVDGLLLPFKLHQWRRLPFLGRILHWFHALGRLHRNMHVIQTRIGAVSGDLQHLQGLFAKVVAEHAHNLHVQGAAISTLPDRAVVSDLSTRIDSLSAQVQVLASRTLEEHETQLRLLDQAVEALLRAKIVEDLGTRIEALALQFAKLQKSVRQQALVLQEVSGTDNDLADTGSLRARHATSAVESHLDDLYARFEEQFRGSREQIRERMAPYLKFIHDVGAGLPSAPVLDLGCGRGERLGLLRDDGLTASGVDLNALFIEECRQKQLDVHYDDAVNKLKSLPDNSVGVVSLFHLVEHLDFSTLVEVIDEARRVLLPQGGLIMETPNPENALVGQWSFYMDPTHRNPLPPQMLRWLVQARGFVQSDIQPQFAARPAPPIDYVPGELPGADTINALVRPHHEALDYAIVARKSVSMP